MPYNRSKRTWQRHEDVLAALEEANDIDTKSLLGPGLGRPMATDPELLDLERKRVSLETSQASSLRAIALIMTLLVISAIGAGLMGDQAKELLGQGGPEMLTPDDLRKMRKNIDDLGGLGGVKAIFREVLVPGLGDPFEDPTKRSKSILMFGPPGCGKTEIAKGAAAKYNYNYIEVTGGQIIGSYVGQSARAIRSYFKKAMDNTPCILFFDEVETLLKQRGSSQGGGGKEDDRTVSEFLTEMNKVFDSDKNVIVIGATNLPESLDSAAVRRFHRRVYIPVPGKDGRIRMLYDKFKKDLGLIISKPLMTDLVEITYGFSSSNVNDCVGKIIKDHRADVIKRIKEANPGVAITKAMVQNVGKPSEQRIKEIAKKCKSTVTSSSLTSYRQWANQFGEKVEEEDAPKEGEHRPITAFDLDDKERKMAEQKARPPAGSALSLKDMSGLEDVKSRLRNAMNAIVMKGGIAPVKHFLLYGPPGTGKSRLAEAVAKTCADELKDTTYLKDKTVTFIHISAADVKGSHVGESERNLTSWFRIAEAYQPSVLFIDEMDTLIIKRNSSQAGGDGGVGMSILGTFLQLTEGPSVNPKRQVLVLGATNYPGSIDSAALRRMFPLHVTLPDDEARKDFFCRGMYNKTCAQVKQESGKNWAEYEEGINLLMTKSQGYSGSDIARIIRVAKEFASDMAYKMKNAGKKLDYDPADAPLEPQHFQAAFLVVQPSASKEDIQNCNNFMGVKDANEEKKIKEILGDVTPDSFAKSPELPDKTAGWFDSWGRQKLPSFFSFNFFN